MRGVVDSVLATVTSLRAAFRTLVQLSGDYNSLLARISQSPGVPSLPTTRSHWQETIPESARLLHASSTALPDHADIVIIGSGITGTLVARALLEHPNAADLKIVMVEARDVCAGATSRNGGHIKCDPHLIYHKHKAFGGRDFAEKATRFSMAHVDELIRLSEKVGGNERTEARRVETVDAYFDPALFARARNKVKKFEEEMPVESKGITVLSAHEAQEKYELSPACVGAIVSHAGAINPYKLVIALLTLFEEKYSDRFTLVSKCPTSEIIGPMTERPFYTLVTGKGNMTASHVVHATNAHVAHLVPGLRSKVFPLRHTMTAQTHRSFPTTEGGRRSFSFLYAEGYDYLTQRPDGTIMIGGGFAQSPQQGMAEVGINTDDAYDPTAAAHLCGALSVLFKSPNNEESEVANDVKSIWAGSIGLSADRMPWVGRLPTRITGRGAPPPQEDSKLAQPGEWVSAGYTGEGMVNAPLCAKALAMMILKPDEDNVSSWFPDEMRISERRCRKADPSGMWSDRWD
ncbi:hypothetical protein FS749_015779 [Ceratobasidium sp. UAMH 11750]|nr:hypothetical protein FS749_015779 [Ceratobasidium sp. UAMH 11750]